MATAWIVELDDSDDNTYGQDISGDALRLEWFVGMDAAFENISSNWAQIKLDNSAKSYNSVPPGRRIRIRSNDGTTRDQFVGYIHNSDVGTLQDQTAILFAFGVELQLQNTEIILEPMQDVTADEIITEVLNEAHFIRDDNGIACEIDFTGRNLIDTCFIVDIEDNLTRTFDTGLSTFAYVGDRWDLGFPAYKIIKDAVGSERGRFLISRSGAAVFLNRHNSLISTSIAHTFDNAGVELDYEFGGMVRTVISISFLPRMVGAVDSILWELGQAQRIRATEQRRITIPFRDTDKNQAGALAVTTPLVEFTSTDDRGGTGDSMADNTRFHILTIGFSGIDLFIENTHPTKDLFLQTLIVRGTPLLGTDPMLLAFESVSHNQYGFRTLALNLPLLTDVDTANSMGDYELQRRQTPVGTALRLRTDASLHPSKILTLEPFDRIKILEAHTGADESYLIVGELHQVDKLHTVEYILELADANVYFVIDEHSIDGSNLLVPF